MPANTIAPPKIVARDAFGVIGLCYRGNNDNQEIPALWDAFVPRAREITHVVNEDVVYGIADSFDRASGTFEYLAGLEVMRDAPVPGGMVSWTIPAQTYAIFNCTLPTLMRTFQFAYDTWMPQADYRRAPGPEFELYDDRFNPGNPDSLISIYIPVRPSAG